MRADVAMETIQLRTNWFLFLFFFFRLFTPSPVRENLPDDVRDGNAIRLVPFRRDRLTYDFDDENEALGMFNALLVFIFTWPFIFGIFGILLLNLLIVLCVRVFGGAVWYDEFCSSSSSSLRFLSRFCKIFRLHNPKMLCTTSRCASVVSFSFSSFPCIRFSFSVYACVCVLS